MAKVQPLRLEVRFSELTSVLAQLIDHTIRELKKTKMQGSGPRLIVGTI